MVADVQHAAAEEFRKVNAANLGKSLGVTLNGVDGSNVDLDSKGPGGARADLSVVKAEDIALLGH